MINKTPLHINVDFKHINHSNNTVLSAVDKFTQVSYSIFRFRQANYEEGLTILNNLDTTKITQM